jgi:uncharacterized protein YjiS (DUF1127 family)
MLGGLLRGSGAERPRAETAGIDRVRVALHRLAATLALWRQRRRERCQLLSLEARFLRDIGLSRYDAIREGRKPFWRP